VTENPSTSSAKTAPQASPIRGERPVRIFDATLYESQRVLLLISYRQLTGLVEAHYSNDALGDEVVRIAAELRALVKLREARQQAIDEADGEIPDLKDEARGVYSGNLPDDWDERWKGLARR